MKFVYGLNINNQFHILFLKKSKIHIIFILKSHNLANFQYIEHQFLHNFIATENRDSQLKNIFEFFYNMKKHLLITFCSIKRLLYFLSNCLKTLNDFFQNILIQYIQNKLQ